MKTFAEALLNFALIFFLVSCFSGCAQVALTGNIINVTVIKAQSADESAKMSGSDIEGIEAILKGGELKTPLK